MPTLDLFLHDRFVGTVEPVTRDRSSISLSVHPGYEDGGIVLNESFATLPGRLPPTSDLSNLLGGYVPEGNHREHMAAKRHIDMDDLFALLREFGGSIAGAVSLRRPDELPGYRPTWEELTECDC